jgi:hypothetical protein
MRSRMWSIGRFAVAASLTLMLGSCSNLPNSPTSSSVEHSPAVSASPLMMIDVDASQSVSSSRVIHGVLGGVVSAGDFTVVIPPLAITGTATVTVKQPDASKPVVELSITPPTANKFRLPVLLVAKASRMSLVDVSRAYISYFNPATQQWERVSGSSVSVADLMVSAPLSHFSQYRVEVGGKAGW